MPKVPTRIKSQPSTETTGPNQEVLNRLKALEENLSSIHVACSEAYASQGDYEGALAHFRAVVEMTPDNAAYRCQLGYLRYLNGDDGAIEDFQFVIREDPSSPDGYFNLAMVYFGQGRHAEAEQNFALAAQYDQQDPETWNNLGVARFQLGRVEDAKACFQRAVELNPDYGEARRNLGDCRV